jgi:O-antigen ligase
MISAQFEKVMSRLLALGVPAISMFLLTGTVTDPVNVTKFLILGAVATSALALIIFRGNIWIWNNFRIQVLLVLIFAIFSVSAVVFSDSPVTQNLYGVYGRNTGLLTYLFLATLTIAAMSLTSISSLNKLFLGLVVTGVVNVLYSIWAVLFGDFIQWNNPYGNILGLFGNPNFIGAFLGIWISSTFGYFMFSKTSMWKKFAVLGFLLLGAYAVYKSHAVQGVVVTLAGVLVVGFLYIRSRTQGNALLSFYSLLVVTAGTFAILGALQKGPLTSLIYKTSVSLRGAYWNAGISMGMEHPFTGVGMDSYGDWYRPSRSIVAATTTPGPNTVTNSAHNVPLDVFSYGGFPLLISYLAVMGIGVVSILAGIKLTRKYDPLFTGLTVAWIGYQIQSIISINQIGLAVWGWVLTGALASYVKLMKKDKELVDGQISIPKGKNEVRRKNDSIVSNELIAGVGLVVGLILAVPPIAADSAWASASRSGNFTEVQKALEPSYLHPENTFKYLNVIETLERSQLHEQAHEYALAALRFNPQNYDLWYALYAIKNSTEAEKTRALKMLKTLDPHNPDVTNNR